MVLHRRNAILVASICVVIALIVGIFVYFNVRETVDVIKNNTGNGDGTGTGNGTVTEECNIDSDCVPNSCCHATGCMPIAERKACDVFCTQECVPGSLDCGQGSCGCVNKKCQAIFK